MKSTLPKGISENLRNLILESILTWGSKFLVLAIRSKKKHFNVRDHRFSTFTKFYEN